MRGWFKTKDSYKSINEEESLAVVSQRKHSALLRGEVVYLETAPRLMDKDFINDLEEVENPNQANNEKAVETKEKSSEPSLDWTKEELKEYMIDKGVAFNGGDTKQDLIDKIKASQGGQ